MLFENVSLFALKNNKLFCPFELTNDAFERNKNAILAIGALKLKLCCDLKYEIS